MSERGDERRGPYQGVAVPAKSTIIHCYLAIASPYADFGAVRDLRRSVELGGDLPIRERPLSAKSLSP